MSVKRDDDLQPELYAFTQVSATQTRFNSPLGFLQIRTNSYEQKVKLFQTTSSRQETTLLKLLNNCS